MCGVRSPDGPSRASEEVLLLRIDEHRARGLETAVQENQEKPTGE
jgi:hypothetical protein